MHNSERPSQGKVAAGVVLAVLGKLGVMTPSFFAFSSVLFFWYSDPLRLLRVFLILGVSVLMLVGAARFFRDNKWWPKFMRSLPFYICGIGCLGVLRTVANRYSVRQPHSVTGYEQSWFFICLVGFIVCLVVLKKSKKHEHHKRHESRAA
jgi:hypothetical protein